MKRFIIIISAILAIICFTGCPSPEAASSDDDVEVTNSDWLFVLYMDADNNLNDSLWADVAYEQLALAYRDGDETFPNVKIVMLWDGQDTAGAEADGNTRIHPRSEIYELGPVDEATGNKVFIDGDKSWLMSKNSKRLTDEAEWLEKEPDMGDVNTLKNFLSWVNERYSAKYKVLLLSDHGAGTDIEMISGGVAQPRSLCTDDSHTDEQGRSKLLTAIDVKNAIAKSGLKPNIIYMDCCLQGNVETAYILRGSADYLVTSANASYSNNHLTMLRSLSVNSTPRDFAQVIVTSYATAHADNTLELSEDRNHASFEETLTQAAYDISEKKQNALYKAMNSLAAGIKQFENNNLKKIFDNYLKQDYANTTNCKGMAYNGTYFTLNDIGYFCNNLIKDDADCVTTGSPIKLYVEDVIEALDDVIVCSWMGKKTPDATKFYYTKNVTIYDENGQKLESEYTDANGQFGLTIATESPNGGNDFLTYVDEKDGTDYYQSFFGYSKIWGELYKYWLSDDND